MLIIEKLMTHGFCRCQLHLLPFRALKTLPGPTRRSALSILTPVTFPGHSVQSSSFFSLPGVPPKKREFSERRLMGYSMDQIFAVVSDIPNYVNFLPWCEESNVTSRTENLVTADLVIGMKPVTESYTSIVTLKRPYLVRAESTQGRHFNTMLTEWKFSPGLKGTKNSCIVDFHVCLEFKSVIHSQIANVFFNEVVRAMTGAFFNEAKRRYGKESLRMRKIAILPAGKNENDL